MTRNKEIGSMNYTAAIVTMSDACYLGKRADGATPAVAELLSASGFTVKESVLLPDEAGSITATLKKLSDKGYDLIVTTGGTGFSPRDVTPEATLALGSLRNVPGVAEAMRFNSMKYTPRAMLSRGVCVIFKKSVIVNLPGSPKACTENLSFVLESLKHGIDALNGNVTECARK